jgi:hypothetical protein
MDKKDFIYLSLPRVILTDGVLLLYLAAVLPSIPIILLLERPYIELLLWIVPIVSLSIYVMTWRYDRVCRTFMFGREVKGKVLSVARLIIIPIQGIEYGFQVDGKKLRHTALYFDGGNAKRLKEGDEISIMLDPDNPKHTYIKDVYLN